MAQKIVITDAGRVELINAQQNGTASVALMAVGFGTGQYTASASQTALQAEFKRLDTIAGGAVGDDVIHFTVTDKTPDAYTVYEVGVYTESGTLFAVYSQTTPIIQKAAVSDAMLAIDIKLTAIDVENITIGDATFTVPPATTERQGLIEIATNDETIAGTDSERAVTPASLHVKTGTRERRGLVQFATAAEVEAGTKVDRVVSPADLKTSIGDHASKKASATVEGHATVDGQTVLATDGKLSVPTFKGFESISNTGAAGLVPKAVASTHYLRSNGQWQALEDGVTSQDATVPASANAVRKAYDRGTEGVEHAQTVESFVLNDVMTSINELSDRVSNQTLTPFCINQGPLSADGSPEVLQYANGVDRTVEIAFEQPILTANGALGGNAFAVSANQNLDWAFRVFNPSNDEWPASMTTRPSDPAEITIYNPVAIKIRSISLKNSSDTKHVWSRVSVYGSNSTSDWVLLGQFDNAIRTASTWVDVAIGSSIAYKYFKLSFTENSAVNSVSIAQIKLNATKVGTVKSNLVSFRGPLVATTAQGEKFTADGIANLDVTAITATTLYVYLNRSGSPTYTAGEFYAGPEEPEASAVGDVWFKTLEPLAAYQRLTDQWYEINLAPVGEVYLDGTGKVTGVSTYPYNQNGYTVNSGTVATASTFGLTRMAAPVDETNCNCDDASITPANFAKMGDYRIVSTAYSVGDRVRCLYHADLFLQCTKAGTTSADALDTHNVTIGQTISDGSVTWTVGEMPRIVPASDVKMRSATVQDVVLKTTDANGNEVIQLPRTRAKNIDDLVNTIYPVGSIYMSASATSPEILFGGSWKALDQGRVLIGAGTKYKAGATGGEAVHTLTELEMPKHSHSATIANAGAHTHTRGTMNITGSFFGEAPGYYASAYSGAFYQASETQNTQGIGDSDFDDKRTMFDASRSWTGQTSSNGSHTHNITIAKNGSNIAHNNMQPYLAVYMWQRIS